MQKLCFSLFKGLKNDVFHYFGRKFQIEITISQLLSAQDGDEASIA